MATDIAFALAALTAAGRGLAVAAGFLLTLAIVDDLGAVAIIALTYSRDLYPPALAGAGLTLPWPCCRPGGAPTSSMSSAF